jgi:hypothetical protein
MGGCRGELDVRGNALNGTDDLVYLDAALFLPVLGLRPTPLKIRLENRGMVVESRISRLASQGGMEPFRLSDESRWRLEASKSR